MISTADTSSKAAANNGKALHPPDNGPPEEQRGDAWEDPRDRLAAQSDLGPRPQGDEGTAGAAKKTGIVHLTDHGNAIRLTRQHGQDLRHCWPWRKWVSWDETRWAIDDTGAIVRCAKETIATLFGWTVREMEKIQKQLEGISDE